MAPSGSIIYNWIFPRGQCSLSAFAKALRRAQNSSPPHSLPVCLSVSLSPPSLLPSYTNTTQQTQPLILSQGLHDSNPSWSHLLNLNFFFFLLFCCCCCCFFTNLAFIGPGSEKSWDCTSSALQQRLRVTTDDANKFGKCFDCKVATTEGYKITEDITRYSLKAKTLHTTPSVHTFLKVKLSMMNSFIGIGKVNLRLKRRDGKVLGNW